MTSRFIADYLRTLKKEGKTIVLSAHNLYQVEAICDKVMILRRGQMVAFGTMHRAPRPVRLAHVLDLLLDRRPGKTARALEDLPAGRGALGLRGEDIKGTQRILGPHHRSRREDREDRIPVPVPRRDAREDREVRIDLPESQIGAAKFPRVIARCLVPLWDRRHTWGSKNYSFPSLRRVTPPQKGRQPTGNASSIPAFPGSPS